MNKDVTNTYKYHEHCCAHTLYKICFVYYMNSYYELVHKFLSNHSPFCIRLLNRPNCIDIFHFNIYNSIPLYSLKYLFVNGMVYLISLNCGRNVSTSIPFEQIIRTVWISSIGRAIAVHLTCC